MKIKTLVKFIFPVVFYFGIVGSSYYFFLVPQLNRIKPGKTVAVANDKLFGWKFPIAKFPLTGSLDNLIAYSSIRDPGGIPKGLPVRLKIPAIGVDSAIEDALITSDGRMDVPAGSVNVAWFSLGPHPGQVGSAVIGGHFGIDNGVKFVFYDLDKITVGNKIYIVDDKNDTLAFVVRAIKSFDRNGDSTTVFTSQDGLAHLNLITCEGTWNQVNGTYPQRLVIFTDAIPSEGAVVLNKPAPVVTTAKIETKITVTPTSLPTELPTILPTPIEKIATPSSETISPTFLQMLIASANILYATPIDGLITFFLLTAIIFITVKIIRR
jgi:LPXTG-site transpeptidase (sortase) family protein